MPHHAGLLWCCAPWYGTPSICDAPCPGALHTSCMPGWCCSPTPTHHPVPYSGAPNNTLALSARGSHRVPKPHLSGIHPINGIWMYWYRFICATKNIQIKLIWKNNVRIPINLQLQMTKLERTKTCLHFETLRNSGSLVSVSPPTECNQMSSLKSKWLSCTLWWS